MASQHWNGKPSLDISLSEGLREKYSLNQGGASELAATCVDSNMNSEEDEL